VIVDVQAPRLDSSSASLECASVCMPEARGSRNGRRRLFFIVPQRYLSFNYATSYNRSFGNKDENSRALRRVECTKICCCRHSDPNHDYLGGRRSFIHHFPLSQRFAGKSCPLPTYAIGMLSECSMPLGARFSSRCGTRVCGGKFLHVAISTVLV